METTGKKRSRKPDPRRGRPDFHRPRKPLWLDEAEDAALKLLARRQGKAFRDVGRRIIRDALRAAGLWQEPEPSPPAEA